MKNKIKNCFKAENNEEIKITNYLNNLYEKNEIKNFVNKVKNEAESQEKLFEYKSRIKTINSAIRTYRLNNRTLEQAHDYLGISIITNNEKEVYNLANHFKEILPKGDFVDLIGEQNIYSPTPMQKWVPPLSYHILTKESLISNIMDVPVEIRICSKEGYIAEQAPYYTIRKNDEIKIADEVRGRLLQLMHHITYKLSLLTIRNCSGEEKEKQINELNKIINENKDFLKENNELCQETIFDFGTLNYKIEHSCEYEKDEKELSVDQINIIDEKIRNCFIKNVENNTITSMCNAVKTTNGIKYSDIKNN